MGQAHHYSGSNFPLYIPEKELENILKNISLENEAKQSFIYHLSHVLSRKGKLQERAVLNFVQL